MQLPFTKMHGLGNDFVVIDTRAQSLNFSGAQFARLADRRYGVGCDQILLINTPTLAQADFQYQVINADGSRAEHCGNGVRCVARYLADRGLSKERIVVEINGACFDLTLMPDGLVRVDMGVPRFAPSAIPLAAAHELSEYSLDYAGRQMRFGAVSMGNPHAVFPVDDVNTAPVNPLGSRLQADALFPAKVNVGFMQVLSQARIRLRVFERGAGETLACGTGACAAVAVGRRWGMLAPKTTVELRGGELMIEWASDDSTLFMTGPAVTVFSGTIDL